MRKIYIQPDIEVTRITGTLLMQAASGGGIFDELTDEQW